MYFHYQRISIFLVFKVLFFLFSFLSFDKDACLAIFYQRVNFLAYFPSWHSSIWNPSTNLFSLLTITTIQQISCKFNSSIFEIYCVHPSHQPGPVNLNSSQITKFGMLYPWCIRLYLMIIFFYSLYFYTLVYTTIHFFRWLIDLKRTISNKLIICWKMLSRSKILTSPISLDYFLQR